MSSSTTKRCDDKDGKRRSAAADLSRRTDTPQQQPRMTRSGQRSVRRPQLFKPPLPFHVRRKDRLREIEEPDGQVSEELSASRREGGSSNDEGIEQAEDENLGHEPVTPHFRTHAALVDEPVHAAEVDMNRLDELQQANRELERQGRRETWRMVFLCFVVMVVVIAATTVIVVFVDRRRSDRPTSDSNIGGDDLLNDITSRTIRPTASPSFTKVPTATPSKSQTPSVSDPPSLSSMPSREPSTSESPTIEVVADLAAFIKNRSPVSTRALADPSSPQSLALEWLTSDSYTLAKIEEGHNERVLQRYGLATFYFAMGGKSSSNLVGWTESTWECSWGREDLYCNDKDIVIEIYLGSRDLSGSLPPELSLLTTLQLLFADDNRIRGSIPSEVGNLSKLQVLWLNSNGLSGTIPTEAGKMEALTDLDLSFNDIQGTIPEEIYGMQLEYLFLNDMKLIGTFSTSIGRLTRLRRLTLSRNSLSGTIPVELGLCTSLELAWLHINKLTGTMPDAICENRVPTLQVLQSDCSGFPAEVECRCCTACCDDMSRCTRIE